MAATWAGKRSKRTVAKREHRIRARAAAPEARGPENDTAPTDPSKSAPVELRLKHVLVVDDDPALRAMVGNYLVDQNVRVSAASNGLEMARVLTAGGVALGVLAFYIGEMHGVEHV